MLAPGMVLEADTGLTSICKSKLDDTGKTALGADAGQDTSGVGHALHPEGCLLHISPEQGGGLGAAQNIAQVRQTEAGVVQHSPRNTRTAQATFWATA